MPLKVVAAIHCAHSCVAGKLHFVKFETAKVEQVIEFIEAKGLLLPAAAHGASGDQRVSIKATGGGAFKFTELFEARAARLSATCHRLTTYILHPACIRILSTTCRRSPPSCVRSNPAQLPAAGRARYDHSITPWLTCGVVATYG